MTKAQTPDWEKRVRKDAMQTHAATTWEDMPTIEMHSYERIIEIFRAELSQQRKEIVEETKVKEYGKDEAYCMWYRCSNCRDSMITEGSNFCPNCGRKIVWGDSRDTTN